MVSLVYADTHYRPVASLIRSHMNRKRHSVPILSNPNTPHNMLTSACLFARSPVRNGSASSFPRTIILLQLDFVPAQLFGVTFIFYEFCFSMASNGHERAGACFHLRDDLLLDLGPQRCRKTPRNPRVTRCKAAGARADRILLCSLIAIFALVVHTAQHQPNVRGDPADQVGRQPGAGNPGHQAAKVRQEILGHPAVACRGMEEMGGRLEEGMVSHQVVASAYRWVREGMVEDHRDRLLLGLVAEAYRREKHHQEAASEGHRASLECRGREGRRR